MQYKLEQPILAKIGLEKYQCTIEWRNGRIIADESVATGGRDTGPNPGDLLLSSLASCTLITLRMYIDHKGWTIPEIAVKVNLYQETKDENLITFIDRDIVFPDLVDPVQMQRLIEVAQRCPISKILENKVQIQTTINTTNGKGS